MADEQQYVPMPMQWAMIDEIVDKYVAVLRTHQATSSDIAVDLLGTEKTSDKRFLAMFAATLLQRLVAQ